MTSFAKWSVCLTLLQLGFVGCADSDHSPASVTETIRGLGAEFEESMQSAELVFVGRVEQSRSTTEEVQDEGSRVVTIHDVTVLESLKGEAGSGVLQVVNLGGELGEIIETVSDQARIEAGQNAIFFVERRGAGHAGWRPIGVRGVVDLQQTSASPVGLTRSALEVSQKWAQDQRRIGFRINPRGILMDGENASSSQSRAIADIEAAAMHWYRDTRANVRVNLEGTTNSKPSDNNYNLVYFSDDLSKFTTNQIALTTTTYVKSEARITRFVMVFNLEKAFHGSALGRCNAASSPKYDVYLEDVATHEFGHALGMNHEKSDKTSTMVSTTGECNTSPRSLASIDIRTLENAYGLR